MISGSIGRYLAVGLSVVLILFVTLANHQYYSGSISGSLDTFRADKTKEGPENIGNETHPLLVNLESPGNRTLGFETIQFINLPCRFDYADTMALQGLTCGLQLTESAGVTPDDIKDKGLAPASMKLNKPQAACFRSHSNLWRKMVNEQWSTMLILESDATWDVNIKPVMKRFSVALNKLLKKSSAVKVSNELEATEEDPYVSANWDLLTFGYCFDSKDYYDDSAAYNDPDAPDAEYYDEPTKGVRYVRRGHAPVCTTAYGISQQGAQKLLLRGAYDYNKPVDLVIMDMVRTGQLITYGTFPVIFAQWEYAKGIGAEQLNSNIDDRPTEEQLDYYDNWFEVHKSRNVWRLNYMYGDSIKNPVFNKFSEFIFGGNSSYPEQELEIKREEETKDEKKEDAAEERKRGRARSKFA